MSYVDETVYKIREIESEYSDKAMEARTLKEENQLLKKAVYRLSKKAGFDDFVSQDAFFDFLHKITEGEE